MTSLTEKFDADHYWNVKDYERNNPQEVFFKTESNTHEYKLVDSSVKG